MKQHIMLDLETLGTRPGSVITSIGAVKFSAGGIGETFYRRIDIADSMKAGLKVDPDTLKFWFKQPDESRLELTEPGELLTVVLLEFNTFIGDEEVCIWGNGASFDNALLAEVYRVVDYTMPWKFWNERCYRTLKALHPEKPFRQRHGVHHNALDDAISQAEHLITVPSFQKMEEFNAAYLAEGA